jgi:hypothetical protein
VDLCHKILQSKQNSNSLVCIGIETLAYLLSVYSAIDTIWTNIQLPHSLIHGSNNLVGVINSSNKQYYEFADCELH